MFEIQSRSLLLIASAIPFDTTQQFACFCLSLKRSIAMVRKRKAKPAPPAYRHVLIGDLAWKFSYSFLSVEDNLTGFPYTVISMLSAEGLTVRGDKANMEKVKLAFYPKQLQEPKGREIAAVGVAYQKSNFTDFVLSLPTADFNSMLPLIQSGWIKHVDVGFSQFKRKKAIVHSVGLKSFDAEDDW